MDSVADEVFVGGVATVADSELVAGVIHRTKVRKRIVSSTSSYLHFVDAWDGGRVDREGAVPPWSGCLLFS